ncbi:hypothetical protein KM043_003373 [Ampulex compressa]|nr:hypothetical protein KM043_003373 [Ampulex compressa]
MVATLAPALAPARTGGATARVGRQAELPKSTHGAVLLARTRSIIRVLIAETGTPAMRFFAGSNGPLAAGKPTTGAGEAAHQTEGPLGDTDDGPRNQRRRRRQREPLVKRAWPSITLDQDCCLSSSLSLSLSFSLSR